jgi:hypothetical protein
MAQISKTLAVASALAVSFSAWLPTGPPPDPVVSGPPATSEHDPIRSATLDDVIDQYCVRCHSDRRMTGNLSLETFDVAQAPAQAEMGERIIRKVRAGMMPPPGANAPAGDTLSLLVETLERSIDEAWERNPNPGGRSFQRLNRAEYERSVAELLSLEIDASNYLPLDMKSANFDNIADAQLLSPTLMDAYLRAADEVSRLAVGVPDAKPNSITYTNSGYTSQWERVPGAPRGTRGGISVVHNFPADGEYNLELWFEHTTTGEFYGDVTPGEQIEISVDGERKALLEVDRWMYTGDPNGASQDVPPIFINSGPHRITAAFIQVTDGPAEDLLSPHDWSLNDRRVGAGGYGVTAWAHLKDLVIVGPFNPTGVSDSPSRRTIFTCRPASPEEARPCAKSIVARLAEEAFRKPVDDALVEAYMFLYDERAPTEGFEIGVRTALQGILASPDFVFRLEQAPSDGVGAGEIYPIGGEDLASRLSFFLWAAPPDQELRELGRTGELHDEDVLKGQVERMLADPRAEALGSRFAAQWLRLEDLEKVNPDRLMFPDYHEQLRSAMLLETEMFFNDLVSRDRSVLDLYTADYSFMNERLARHYGIDGISGEALRRVEYPDARRRGILGHASVLTLTSHAGRTSPVLRGKWVMEVIMGTPPPPPPPNVPTLEESTSAASEGRYLTTGERMAQHRANPTCNSCHRMIDPIGLALDNFDVTGRWRIRENGVPIDTRTEFYDGTPMETLPELLGALMTRRESLLRNFTQNLMAYGLGRRIEYYDMPTVRRIVRDAEADGFAVSAFVWGVVQSDAFRMRRAAVTDDQARSR